MPSRVRVLFFGSKTRRQAAGSHRRAIGAIDRLVEEGDSVIDDVVKMVKYTKAQDVVNRYEAQLQEKINQVSGYLMAQEVIEMKHTSDGIAMQYLQQELQYPGQIRLVAFGDRRNDLVKAANDKSVVYHY